MSMRHTVLRALHDVGLGVWFGGFVMGAIGVNGAAGEISSPQERHRVANAGWGRWTPIGALGIAAHVAGAAGLARTELGRVAGQRGVLPVVAAKTGLTAAALGLTAYGGLQARTVMRADVPIEGATDPAPETPADIAAAQRRLNVVQWAVPALTGALTVVSALAGEQQRPTQVAGGLAGRAKQAAKAAVSTSRQAARHPVAAAAAVKAVV